MYAINQLSAGLIKDIPEDFNGFVLMKIFQTVSPDKLVDDGD
jgi:hypothetical protein